MITITYPHLVKSRKDHFCDYCGSKINKGDIYENSVYKYDCGVYQWKSHEDCSWIASKLKMYDRIDDNGLTYEMFRENIYNEFLNLEFEKTKDNLFSLMLKKVIEYHKHREIVSL